MRHKISPGVWAQIDVAIAAGVGAREIARKMGLPEGTILSHLKRKGVSSQIRDAKAVIPTQQATVITPLQSAAMTIQERGQKHVERMATVSEKGLSALESMDPEEIVQRAREIELHDRWSRRNYGLDNQPASNGAVNFHILCNQAAIVAASPTSESDPTP